MSANNGGSGILVFSARRVDIVNNAAHMNGQVVGYADIFASCGTDVKLYNNISYAKPGGKANDSSNNYYNHTSIAACTKGSTIWRPIRCWAACR